jgi:hypothetical protein
MTPIPHRERNLFFRAIRELPLQKKLFLPGALFPGSTTPETVSITDNLLRLNNFLLRLNNFLLRRNNFFLWLKISGARACSSNYSICGSE